MYQVARRCGLLSSLEHLDNLAIYEKVQQIYHELSTMTDDVEEVVDQLANVTFKTRYADSKSAL